MVDSLVGQEFVAKIGHIPVGTGKILQADVIDYGFGIDILVEFPDDKEIKRMLGSFDERVSINGAQKDNHV